jgi:hypothetical protein
VGQANGEVSSSLDSVTTPKITTYEAVARQLRYSHSVGYRRLDTELLTDMLHVQSNPLPICTRPRVLIKGKRT